MASPRSDRGDTIRTLSTALALSALTLLGCSGSSRQLYGRLEAASPAPLIEILEQQRGRLESLSAVAKIRITFAPLPGEEAESFSTSQAVLAASPASFRLDTLSPFGVSYAAISDGQRIAVLAPEEGTIYRGRATPTTIASATGVEAGPEEITQVLLGRPPMVPIQEHLAWVSSAHDGGRTTASPGGKGAEVFLHAPIGSGGSTILVGFAEAPVAGGVPVAVSFERISRDGVVQLAARFEEHREIDGQVVPTKIYVTAPGSTAQLNYRDIETNPQLEPSNFELPTPPGMRTLPLGGRMVSP